MSVEINVTPPVSLKQFAEYANNATKKTQVFKIMEGEIRHEVHSVPCDGSEGAASLLPHIWSFNLNISEINFENPAIKLRLFGSTLTGNAKARWLNVYNRVIQEIDDDEEDIFIRAQNELIAQYCDEDARDAQLQYVRTVKKPGKSMSVRDFQMNLENCNTIASWMPGESPILTEDELRRVFVHAMPEVWQTTFLNAGRTVANTTMLDCVAYFGRVETAANKISELNSQRQRTESHSRRARDDAEQDEHKSKRQRHKGRSFRHRGRSPPKSKNNNSTHNNNNHKATEAAKPEDPCPIHKYLTNNHTWGDCTYKKAFDEARKSSSKGANTKKKPTTEANVADSSMNNESELASVRWGPDTFSAEESTPVVKAMPRAAKGTLKAAACSQQCSTITHSFIHHLNDFVQKQVQNLDATSETDLDAMVHITIEALYNHLESDSTGVYEMQNLFLASDVIVDKIPPSGSSINYIDSTLSPWSILIVNRLQDQPFQRPLRALFDPGSDCSHIQRRRLPTGLKTSQVMRNVMGVTGSGKITEEVALEDMLLPEFSRTLRINDRFRCYIMDNTSSYDVILGRDFLCTVGIDVLNSTRQVDWLGHRIPFRRRDEQVDPFDLNTACMEMFASDMEDIEPASILDAKYEAVDPVNVAQQQLHLSPQQRNDLANLLGKFTTLFNGQLRRYPHRKVHLELVDNARPVHQRPYPVPHANLEAFKKELEHLCRIGVLEPCGASEWAAPTFIIPKKDGRVRWVSDFRELNKVIKRKIYPLPRIQDILRRRHGYKFFSKLDISMQFYTFELDDYSKDLCIIVTPFGKYRYNRLPMGVTQSPDISQEIMEDVLRDLAEVEVYIDDVGCFDDSWQQHLSTLEKVLKRLEDNGFAINPLKCEWGVQETDWLGYWLTPMGLKPWRKKIDAILQLSAPRTLKEVRSFIGAVTYYRDMYPRRSHILAPLTELTKSKSKKITWTERHQKAFDEMKAVMAHDAMIRYPDHNLPFHVYTDASDLQLGSVIMQNKAPVAFYSRKLNAAQRNYSTIEKELLSIVETLREYRTMLFGCKELHVHTDHRNLTYNKLNSQRVVRWRLFLEEFHPILHYVKGEENGLADTLSRLPRTEGQSAVSPPSSPNSDLARDPAESFFHLENHFSHFSVASSGLFNNNGYSPINHDEDDLLYSFSVATDDDALLQCLLNFPEVDDDQSPHPLDFQVLATAQNTDEHLQQKLVDDPTHYARMLMAENVQLICYVPPNNQPWKICVPDALIDHMIEWYHVILNHVGITRLQQTMALHFYHREMRTRVERLVTVCEACQRHKLSGRGYGELPPREAQIAPWQQIAVDLIGPWKIRVNENLLTFRALTIIDTVTNLPELIRISNKSAAHVGLQLENAWLSRYPRPQEIIFDQGSEFLGAGFQRILDRHHIRKNPTTVKNPQANAICERLHQTVTNTLRPLLHMHPPQNIDEANLLIDTALQTAAYSARTAIHTTLKISPGALAFHRDMLLNIPVIADLQLLRENRQALIDTQLMRANRSRISHDYQPNDQVLVLTYKPDKLEPRATGPFTIDRVHTNGTITIRRNPHITERINIRRVRPFRN